MEVPEKQPPAPMQDILYYQDHAYKWDTGCEPWVCTQNITCDHLNTAQRENANQDKKLASNLEH